MARVLKNELQDLRQNLMNCFQKTLPSEQFSALLFLSIIELHVLADREEAIQDPKERRRMESEFDQGKRAIEHGIQRVHEQTEGRNSKDSLKSPISHLQRLWSTYHP